MDQLSENNYADILNALKEKIRASRLKAVFAVNQELLKVYWEIGKVILEQQQAEGWGSKVIDRLAHDLKVEFPDLKGVSARNLKYMRSFAEAYPDFTIVQAAPAQLENTDNQQNVFGQAQLALLSWYHHTTLLDKVKDYNIRSFYIAQTIQNGWSRDVMVHQIESGLHNRIGKIQTNFPATIPENSELVQQIFKDPYKFEFIYLSQQAKEKDLEDALVNQLTKFLLELGQHFAFLGRQYKVTVGEKEFFFDLLFYHTRLKRYIVIDLKIDEFKPEYKGKMEFYLNVADDHLKQNDDEKSIGIILCKTKDSLVVEYALRDSSKPIGIAEYHISEALPENIKGDLPTIEELEAEIERGYEELKSPADRKFDKIKELLGKLKTDEIREKRTEAKCQEILTKLIFPLRNSLETSLKETIELFDECVWTYSIENNYRNTEETALQQLNEKKVVQNMELQLRLSGMRKAGVKTFSIWTSLCINLQEYYYRIGKEQFPKEIWYESVYHVLPNEEAMKDLEEKFKATLYDSITENLERINQ